MSIMVYGKNAVRESLSEGAVLSLNVSKKQEKDPLVALAREKKIPVRFCSDEELSHIAKAPSHQGFVAICPDFKTWSLSELIDSAKGKANPLFLMLDGIEDPHNLGAILRSVDAFGVDGVIMKKRNEVPLNSTVAKVSTGAIHHVKVSVVSNLTQAIHTLKDEGYWVVASDGEGKQSYTEIDYKGPIVLVVGSEGFGISRLVLRESDFIVKIPMVGHVNSLNASVAAAILLSFVSYARG